MSNMHVDKKRPKTDATNDIIKMWNSILFKHMKPDYVHIYFSIVFIIASISELLYIWLIFGKQSSTETQVDG